jgi:UDP-GlcNAc:undecaprenyl-phosphate GlcNAc-1-phosphate transferase
MQLVITAFLICFGITFLVTPWVVKLAKYWQLVDDPKKRYHPAQTHTTIVPRAGGLALAIGLIIGIVLFLPQSPFIPALLLSIGLLTFVGILDDKKDISPVIRLITNAIAVGSLILSGITIPFITHPFSNGVLYFEPIIAMIAAFIWIYWTMNIIGWSAGVDGQLPGIVVIASIVLGILSLRFISLDPDQIHVTILAGIIAGTFLGFLPWNFYPQKIMPGYSGKTLAGLCLGLLGILSYAKLGTALLVLGIPMIDAFFTLLRRILAKKSPLRADRGHLHHLLLDLGFSKRIIALFYYALSAILGLIALSVSSTQKLIFFILVAVVVSGFLLWAHWLFQSSKQHDQDNG